MCIAVLAALFAAVTLPIGAVDTIGGSVYDCSTICAGQQRMVYYDPGYGVHAAWVWSTEMTGTSFADRNVRYNFRDDNTGEWQWLDPDYMLSGVNAFPYRVGYGAIDLDPTTHNIVLSCHSTHGGLTIHPDIARQVVPGSDVFEYIEGDPDLTGYQWPWHAVSSTGTIHIFPITAAYMLAYSRCVSWPNVTPPVNCFPPDPSFPTHLITASKQSTRVCAMWEDANTDLAEYYSISEDDGATWPPPIRLAPPPAYGGDTVTSFHIASMGAVFDREDELNIVAAVGPVVNDTGYIMPAEIWHYNQATEVWREIARAGCEPANLHYSVGYQSLFACRPKVGQDPETGRLCVIWSQFDSANVDTSTWFLRADVWCSTSPNGEYWAPPVNLTGPDSSCRLYCDLAPIVNDTMHIVYFSDLQAGMYVQSQGVATRNPICYMKVPVSAVAVDEMEPEAGLPRAAVRPSIASGVVWLDRAEAASVWDEMGRKVAVFKPGQNDLGNLRPGVYFVGAEEGTRSKLVVQGSHD
jgi:hypothetical protein